MTSQTFATDLRFKADRLNDWRRAFLSVSRALYPYGYVFKARGEEGKGAMKTYFLIGTSDRNVTQPNDQFGDLPIVSHPNPTPREKSKATWRTQEPVEKITFVGRKGSTKRQSLGTIASKFFRRITFHPSVDTGDPGPSRRRLPALVERGGEK